MMRRTGFARKTPMARSAVPMKKARKKRPGHNQAMLDSCRGQRCWLLVPGIACTSPESVVPAHRNEGKGMGLKVPDELTVPACYACHTEYDQGKRFLRDEKRRIWDDAYIRWSAYRIDGARNAAI